MLSRQQPVPNPAASGPAALTRAQAGRRRLRLPQLAAEDAAGAGAGRRRQPPLQLLHKRNRVLVLQVGEEHCSARAEEMAEDRAQRERPLAVRCCRVRHAGRARAAAAAAGTHGQRPSVGGLRSSAALLHPRARITCVLRDDGLDELQVDHDGPLARQDGAGVAGGQLRVQQPAGQDRAQRRQTVDWQARAVLACRSGCRADMPPPTTAAACTQHHPDARQARTAAASMCTRRSGAHRRSRSWTPSVWVTRSLASSSCCTSAWGVTCGAGGAQAGRGAEVLTQPPGCIFVVCRLRE